MGLFIWFLFFDCNDCVCVFTLIGYDLILIFSDDFFDENEEVVFSSNIIKCALNRIEYKDEFICQVSLYSYIEFDLYLIL